MQCASSTAIRLTFQRCRSSRTPRKHQPFRRGVKQAILVPVQAGQSPARLGGGREEFEKGRRNAARLQGIDLVLHQRDQRRNNDRQSRANHRGQLEAERFSAAGGQKRKDVPAFQSASG